jgi:hypothetical protein
VKGLSTLLVEIEQFAPNSIIALASATARITLCSMWRAPLNRSVAGSTSRLTPESAILRATAASSASGRHEYFEP